MIIDTSAVVAILFDEPDQRRYDDAIETASTRLMSAATRLELSFVIEGRKHEPGRLRLERFMTMTGVEIFSVTPQQADIAIEAFRRFGKGRHLAGLNIGDCFFIHAGQSHWPSIVVQGPGFCAHGHQTCSARMNPFAGPWWARQGLNL